MDLRRLKAPQNLRAITATIFSTTPAIRLFPVGTATIAAEIFDEIPAPDIVFVPMGDTALIRGVAAEAKRCHPGVHIIGVQAEQAPAYVRSWQLGRVVLTDAMRDDC